MTTPRDVLAAAHASWNAGDLDGYLTMYDDRIQLHGYTPQPLGKHEARAFYDAICTAFGFPSLTFDEVLWSDDTAAIRFTMRGTHVGEFMGVPPTGTEISLPGITILRFEDDKVVERWSQADMLGLLVQLGAVPAPA
jgi:SnoaL-like polyketide cyclase